MTSGSVSNRRTLIIDITTLAAWGEFIGGVAVVVSLIYLAVQIRANTKTVRASNYAELLTSNGDFDRMVVGPDMASLFVRGLDGYDALSTEDQTRFTSLMSERFRAAQRAWSFHQQALLNDQMFESQANVVVVYLERDGVKEWWEVHQYWWPADFRDFVNQRRAA